MVQVLREEQADWPYGGHSTMADVFGSVLDEEASLSEAGCATPKWPQGGTVGNIETRAGDAADDTQPNARVSGGIMRACVRVSCKIHLFKCGLIEEKQITASVSVTKIKEHYISMN